MVELPDFTRVALPWARVKPILATLGELYFSERMGSALHLPVTDAARLAELEQAAQLRWVGGERLRELGRKLDGFEGIAPVEVPAGLQASLRPYQQIAAFQQGAVGIFLISLKAGGAGLNLTAADTVIHYDPWWNPASENQATDRAWRIGQDRPVFVYKLIARGTLEEKIQELQRRKGELAHAWLDAEGAPASMIGPDELREILALPACR